VQGDTKWLWFLQTVPAPLPNQGIADRLEEAKAALASRYEQVKRVAAVGAIASGSEHDTMRAMSHRMARSLSVSAPTSSAT
jgi:glycerol dehydrogenase-like iron-containing ADH family enzyme